MPSIKYDLWLSGLASVIYPMGENISELAIASHIQSLFVCIENSYKNRLSYANSIMTDKLKKVIGNAIIS